MTAYKDIKIYLLDRNKEMCISWHRVFDYFPRDVHSNVKIVHDDFSNFIKTTFVEGVVSPANSYGLMDGGYDYAITSWFGSELSDEVKKHIVDNFCGEQPVGSAICISIPTSPKQKLIHCPTMRIPSQIKDYSIVYQCTRSTVLCAMKNDVKSIVLPAFGACCGQVPLDIVARYMERALHSFENVPTELDWKWAYKSCSLGQVRDAEKREIYL